MDDPVADRYKGIPFPQPDMGLGHRFAIDDPLRNGVGGAFPVPQQDHPGIIVLDDLRFQAGGDRRMVKVE